MADVGFVGLGVMGGPMAGHLAVAGRKVAVWNRTPGKSAAVEAEGAKVAGSLTELAAECPVVCLCVRASEDVAECVDSMLGAAQPGTLFIDHSTISPIATLEIAGRAAQRGMRFADAPITGGSVGAQKGQLTIFCGGSENDVDEAIRVVQPYAKRAERVGPLGSGQKMKLANQIAVGGALIGLCECLSFAAKAGLDLLQAKEMIGAGAAGSWAFDNYGPRILARDWSPGFSVANQRKDFAYCLEAGREADAALPGTELVDRLLAAVEADGHGGWTTAGLYEKLLAMGANP